MKARDTIQSIVQLRLAATLKQAGFRKNGLSFARRCGAVAHFVEIQLSSWNQGSNGAFYVNVGIMVDAIRQHYGREVPVLPKHQDCDFMIRLERIFPEAPVQWTVDESTLPMAVSDELVRCVMAGFVHPAATVFTLADFEQTGWLTAIPWGLPAICAYLLDRDAAAEKLVRIEADTFRDRGLTVEGLLASYRFARLQHNPS